MANALDMSLDDLIKKNKQSGRGGRGGRGSGRANGASAGPLRNRAVLRSANRAAPYSLSKTFQQAPETAWQHDLFDAQMTDVAPSNRLFRIETGTKVAIENLDYGVSNDDIKELFSEIGVVKRHQVHYDRSGRSKGTAEVVFARREDAEAAVRRYNNVQLDGKPLKINVVGANIPMPPSNYPAVDYPPRNWTPDNAFLVPLRGRGRGAFQGSGVRGRGRGRGRGFGRGRGRGRQSGEEKSAEDLDAELESYHAEAMQTN